ncbi:MAG: O-antigen ligase family protein [Acidimicrobiaceae bacterium]|nr:O-antigen ligase family protein [Acidimicrobiaceae bacterium]
MCTRSLHGWRAAAGAALLLVFSNGPVVRLAGWLDRPGLWNDPAVWPFFAGAAAASVVLAWAVWRRGDDAAGSAGREVPAGRALSRLALAVIAWYSGAAVVSSLWSVYPSATLWRSVVYLGLVFLAAALAGLTDDELSVALVLLAGVAVAGSLAVLVLNHDVGTDRDGNWTGMYANRNSLAPMAALGVIAGLRWLLNRPGPMCASRYRRVWGAVLVVAALVTMIGAGSRTAWLALAAALALTSVFGAMAGASRRRSWRPRQAWVAASGASLVAVGVGVAVVAAAWNVSTFAQRRTIWSLVWDRVLERPWGGYGFFAFWEVPELVAEHVLLERGSAHNSLVETALGLGLLGTVPFVVLIVLAAVNAGRGLWLRPSADTGMWAAVTVFVLFENTTESFVLWFSHIWVLMVAASLRRSAPAASSSAAAPGPDLT